jgi:nucleoside phosphorylase
VEIGSRTGALVEDMESAAVGLAAHRLGLAFACVRVVSNRTGNRAEQGWDLGRAFAVLEAVAASL